MLYFLANEDFPQCVVAWVCIPRLYGAFYKRNILTEIGSLVGKVVKVYLQTEKGARGQFARFAVQVNLSKPLVSMVRIANKIHRVKYESLPLICFKCGRFGHLRESCTHGGVDKEAVGMERVSLEGR